ncbi:MAG: HIT family protein [Beijerinckiaceae bacterium]
MKIPYDHRNVFAKILRGELPAHAVYEDADSLAFMDIMPRGPGHTLVIPKQPSRNILDAADGDLSALIIAVRKVATGVKAAMGAEGVTIQQYNEIAGGQVVFHLHFHVIPRFTGIALGPHTQTMASGDALKADAEKIRAAIAAL